MPYSAPHPCNKCQRTLTRERFCDPCLIAHNREYEAARADDPIIKAYKSERWRKLSIAYRKRHPICAVCGELSQETDHKIPVRKGGDMWSWKNLQALCKPCHSKKTIEDGRFARRV